MSTIAVEALTKRYGTVTAVSDLYLRAGTGPHHRVPRPERSREIDHHPAAARPGRADLRPRHHQRAPLPGTARPAAAHRRADRPGRVPSRAVRADGAADRRTPRADRRPAGRGGARARRARRRRAPPGRRLLPGHAAAARTGRRAARRPGDPGPGRARQRARPRGRALAARPAARPGRPRAAPSSYPATCSPNWPRPSTTWSSSTTAGSWPQARWPNCSTAPAPPRSRASSSTRPRGTRAPPIPPLPGQGACHEIAGFRRTAQTPQHPKRLDPAGGRARPGRRRRGGQHHGGRPRRQPAPVTGRAARPAARLGRATPRRRGAAVLDRAVGRGVPAPHRGHHLPRPSRTGCASCPPNSSPPR